MTVEQFIADTLAVTDYLRERFDQDKIYPLGHSWAASSASRQRPGPPSATTPTSGWCR
jgi:hypothetical protein